MFIPAFNVVIKDGKISQTIKRIQEKQKSVDDKVLEGIETTTINIEEYVKNNNKFIEFRKKEINQLASANSYMINNLEDISKKAESIKNGVMKAGKWFYDIVLVYEENDFIVFDNSYYRKEFAEFMINFINYSLYYVYILSMTKNKNFVIKPDNTLIGIRYVDDFEDEQNKYKYDQSMKLFAPVILYTEKTRDISEAIHSILSDGTFSAEKLERVYKNVGFSVDLNYLSEQLFVASCEFYNDLLKQNQDNLSDKSILEKIIVYNAILSSFYYFNFQIESEDVVFINALAKSNETKSEMEITIMSKDKITKKDFYERLSMLE